MDKAFKVYYRSTLKQEYPLAWIDRVVEHKCFLAWKAGRKHQKIISENKDG